MVPKRKKHCNRLSKARAKCDALKKKKEGRKETEKDRERRDASPYTVDTT
jgi:hypothetical protein